MAQFSPTDRYHRQWRERTLGKTRAPAMLFDLALCATITVWLVAALTLHGDAVLPLVTGILFLLAGLTALWAWMRHRRNDPRHLTFWDVAGALTLIGICTAALVEPDQLVRLVAGTNNEP